MVIINGEGWHWDEEVNTFCKMERESYHTKN